MPIAWFALEDLSPLLMFFGGWILCLLAYYIAKAFFTSASGAVSWLPGVGGWLKGKVENVGQHVTNVIGGVVLNLQARMAASWHRAAREVEWIGREIASHAALIERIANDLVTANFADLIHLEVQGARKLLHYLARQIVGIGHDVTIRVKNVERGIGADVLPRIRGLERELHRTIEHDIASLRARDRALAREYDHLYRWLRSHPWTIVTDAFVGAVAIALTRLGLTWIRCPSLGRLGKRFGCAPWQLLEDLLAASLTAIAVADLCTFANLAMDTAVLIRPALLALVDVEDALVGCHGASGVPPLEPARLRLPSNSRNLPLAA